MQIVYIPSESMSVQGKKDEIYKRYGKDWNIREQGGGNGNWLLTRKSDVLVDGKSYRTFVLEHYGKSKLTAKLVDKFREDVANGKIKGLIEINLSIPSLSLIAIVFSFFLVVF